MKSRSLRLLALLVIVLTLGISASAVFAGTVSFSGTFTAGDPTMPVVFISSPLCVGQGATLVRYDSYPFTVTATGAYNFTVASTGGADTAASIYIMNSGFNPAAAFPNCLYASNNTPASLSNVALTAGTQYYMVIIDDTNAGITPGYTGNADGVGDIILGILGSTSCPKPLPSGSVIRNVPLGAPAYYEASAGARTTFDLPAGNWYVAQTSGDFAQVWIACQANLVWIPVTALGG